MFIWIIFIFLSSLFINYYRSFLSDDNWFKTVNKLSSKAIQTEKPVYFRILWKKYKIVCDESLLTELDINWRPRVMTGTFNSLLPGSFFVKNFKKYPEARNEKKLLVRTVSNNDENFRVIMEFINKKKPEGNVDMLVWTNTILYGIIGKLVMGIEFIPEELNIADIVHRVSTTANEIMKNELLWTLPHKQYEIYKLKKEVYNTTRKLFKANEDRLDNTKYVGQMAKYYNTNIYASKVINKTGISVFLAAENTISFDYVLLLETFDK